MHALQLARKREGFLQSSQSHPGVLCVPNLVNRDLATSARPGYQIKLSEFQTLSIQLQYLQQMLALLAVPQEKQPGRQQYLLDRFGSHLCGLQREPVGPSSRIWLHYPGSCRIPQLESSWPCLWRPSLQVEMWCTVCPSPSLSWLQHLE
jgi:hypothetical protein